MLWDNLVSDNDEPLIVSSNSTLFFDDLNQLKKRNIAKIQRLRSASVAISGDDISLTILLSMLDGVASSILLISSDASHNDKRKFYENSGIDFKVSLSEDELNITTIKMDSDQKMIENSQQNTDWIIPTSGTSGTPKLIAHKLNSLSKTTKLNSEIGKSIKWGLSYSISRFAGIQIMLQSLLSGSSLLIPSSKLSFSEQIRFFVQNNCNAISGTPTFWRKLLMTGYANKLNLKIVTLGGEIVDQHILDALSKKYSDAKITHIYASTEVGVGFAVKDGLEGFPETYVEEGVPGGLLKVESDGTLMIKPNQQIQKFLTEGILVDKEGYIDTGDIVVKEKNRYIFLGRKSGSINVGGNKVMPEEVEALLMKSGLIKGVRVYGRPNPIMGNLICADIISLSSEKNNSELKKKLKLFSNKNIERYKRPAKFNFVKDFDMNQSGKIIRK